MAGAGLAPASPRVNSERIKPPLKPPPARPPAAKETTVAPPKLQSLQLDPLREVRCAAHSVGLLWLRHAATLRAPLAARARLRRRHHRAAAVARVAHSLEHARHHSLMKCWSNKHTMLHSSMLQQMLQRAVRQWWRMRDRAEPPPRHCRDARHHPHGPACCIFFTSMLEQQVAT